MRPSVSLPSPRRPRGALAPGGFFGGFMREKSRREPLHHRFMFNSAVGTLKPHRFGPDAGQGRVVNVKVQIDRLSGLRAPTNEMTHRVPPISKRASAPSSPAACWFGARGSNQSVRPSDALKPRVLIRDIRANNPPRNVAPF